ncbi:MAG: hypothetical protein GY856_32790 [bacterium]|nr:hypothetical protein [bacterium]
MRNKPEQLQSTEIECLNSLILNIDLDDLEVEQLEQRIELTVAAICSDFDPDPSDCAQFSCMGFVMLK